MNCFILGGFFISRSGARASYMDGGLLPDAVVSASPCIAPSAPCTWALDWVTDADQAARLEKVREFGLDASRLDEMTAWTTARFGHGCGWPNLFTELEPAIEFMRLFVPNESPARLLAIAVSTGDASAVVEDLVWPNQGECALSSVVKQTRTPPDGGRDLGSDIIGVDLGGWLHSFLCHGFEKEVLKRFNARPNPLGLYEDYDIARLAAQAIEADGGAEPGPWLGVRIFEYARTRLDVP